MSTILIVDDHDDIRELLRDFFHSNGHRVVTAADADECLERVRDEKPVLILMDIMMPRVHGVEAMRRVKAIDPNIMVIMITAVDDKEISEEAMASGATDYITKPIDLQYLDTIVTFALFS